MENVRDLLPHGAEPDMLPLMAVEVRALDGIRCAVCVTVRLLFNLSVC